MDKGILGCKRVIPDLLWKALILAVLFSLPINAQKIKDLPKITSYTNGYTDSLEIVVDRHDSTKTIGSRYFKYGMYRWTTASKFYPDYWRQTSAPTPVDSNSIWYDVTNSLLKYWNKTPNTWTQFNLLTGTHIDPTGVYGKWGVFNRIIADTISLSGTLTIADNSQISGLNASKTYKQATDPDITNVLNVGDLWVKSAANDGFQTLIWTGSAWADYLPGLFEAPTGSGLLLTKDYMGYYSSSAFQTYIRSNGYFYFSGDVNNYIKWLGDTLTVKGKIVALNSNDFGTATTFAQTTAPVSGMKLRDLWIDTDDGNAIYVYLTGTGWVRNFTVIDGGWLKTGIIDASLAKITNLIADSIKAGTFTGLTFQTKSAGNARVRINGSNNRIEWVKADNTVGSYLDQSGGNLVLSGKMELTSSDTITGGVIRTAGTGARAELNGSNNDLRFYSTTGSVIGTVSSGSNILQIDGSSLTLSGSVTSDITLITHTAAGFYGDINLTSSRNIEATGTGSFTWNGAALATQSWVSGQGYLTGYPGAGIAVSTGSAWGTSITDNSANWNTAYGWGNHASAGYLTAAVTAINGSTAGSHSISAGNGVLVSSVGAVHTVSAKAYSATGITVDANGIGISAGNGLGNSANQLVAVVTSPLTFTAGSISMPAAATAQNGYLTSTDWNMFATKSDAAYSSGGNSGKFVATVSGGSPTTELGYITITIGGVSYKFLYTP